MKHTEWIWRDGALVKWNDATVHVSAHALHYGSSVFEGIRAYATKQGVQFFRLRDHLVRLIDSARVYGMPLQHDLAALRVDGARTLPMNRADLAGLEFAWAAFTMAQPQADANTKKAFFTAWANLWAKTQTTEALRAEVQGSPYAPAAFRVNGPLSQLPAFGETYGCRVGAVMRAANPIGVWR